MDRLCIDDIHDMPSFWKCRAGPQQEQRRQRRNEGRAGNMKPRAVCFWMLAITVHVIRDVSCVV